MNNNELEKQDNGSNNSKVLLKSGVWYTVCNFLFKAMTFFATPFFSRILTKGEMGSFTNFSSWLLILTVITAFDLQQSIILLKQEREDDMDSYIFSILSLTTVANIIFYVIVMANKAFFLEMFGIEEEYLYLMFLYLLFTPAYQMYITKHRAYYKYKSFVAITGICIVSSVVLSVVFLLTMSNKLTARLWGNYLPFIVVGIILYIAIVIKGKKIKLSYWKYSMALCLPLVPHVLSLFLLGSSDKIIITKYSGVELTAMYGIAYLIYNIVSVLFDSLNKAWTPWLIENLHKENHSAIKKFSRYYILIFSVIVLGTLLLAPEAVFILGGSKYKGAEYCVPPMVASCFVQLIYTMYVNIEFYKKKTVMVSVATISATAINIVLNLIFIPMMISQGHIVAAYTSLVGYLALFIIHFYIVKRMDMTKVYDTKFNIISIGVILVLSFIATILYRYIVIRYGVILILAVGVIVAGIKIYKNKDELISKFKNA